MKQILIVAALAALVLGPSACGRKVKTETNVTNVSEGQQLTDLQKAYESGAISEAEYEKKKKEILKKK